MRVLVVTQYFWPENFRVNDLVAELTRRGHEVTVLTGVPNYPDGAVLPEFAADRAAFARYGGVAVMRVPMLTRGSGSLRLMLNYLSFALSASIVGPWRLRGVPVDAIFVFQPSPITACLPALVAGAMKRAPVLLWVLDLWPETLSAVGAVRSPRVLALVGTLVRFIYRRCALVLGQSRSFGENIARYAGTADRFRYFPSWAEPLFDGSLEAIEPAPELGPFVGSGFNVLFAGNIGDAQDFPTILDAAAALRDRPDIRWLIVGDGRAAEQVRAAIGERQLSGTVFLLGRFPVERMPAFFRGADALLVTLKRDPVFAMTIPGKLQAYLAAGLPVIGALDGEGARAIEESGAGVVVPAGDGAALAARTRELADASAGTRHQMGDRGRAYCRREFDRATLMAQLESWMRECVDQGRVPA